MYSGPPLWCLPLEAVIGTASNLVLNVGVGRERPLSLGRSKGKESGREN